MKETAKTRSSGQAETRSARKPYKRPELRDFGKLHLVTQSTGPSNGDAAQNMMP